VPAVSVTTRLPWDRVEGKIQSWHRDRLAAVYVRQSTAAQVVEHSESTRLQYGLTERAVALGWARSRVLVIDEDLGHSAAGIDARPGFARLVSEVGLDHVGIVLGIEMSRLARSGREGHQLLELCALSGTLLGDLDGVYDPAEHNDRLLLGLKGTISEAELHLIKQRMWSGRIAKARRGELAVPLPIGYVHRPSGEVALDPDEQVQAVVRLVFDAFERLGTIGAVLAFLADNSIQLGVRCHEGPERGELVWRRPSRVAITNLLHNPAYAGVYAYGRSTLDPKRRRAGRPFTGRVRVDRGNWIVFLPGLLPSYISVGQYEWNLERMNANRARAESLGAVRDGPALLAGLVVCGRCSKKMTVHYQHGPAGRLQPVYACDRDNNDHAGPRCQRLAGACVDAAVTELLLAAIAPAALEVSLAAAEQVEAGREAVDRIWRQRLERAEFAADRARRQYQLAEPENRLVTRALERDWEAALAERERLGEEYARFTATRPRTLTVAERDQIRALAADIPGIWHARSTTDADRKQLLRALVEQVRVTVLGDSEKVDVQIVWAGGHHTRTQIVRPVAKLTQLSYYPQLAARVRELADGGHTLAQIAERLNAEGFRPPKRIPVFTPNAVTDLLRALGIHRSSSPGRRNRPVLAEHEWWLRDLAEHLGMPAITLDAWIRRGWATGYLHPDIRMTVVRADPAEIDRLRALHQLPLGAHTRRPWLRNQAALINPDQEGDHGDADQPRL
jgi:DNA invertase Pin-like site-specific DNA recombinase